MPTMKETLEHTLKNGGGSYHRITLEPIAPRDTWAVGIKGVEIDLTDTVEHIEHAFAMACIDALMSEPPADRDEVFGTWIDENVLYADRVALIDDLETAIACAVTWQQKAVYNLRTGITLEISK